ncbi:MAG: GGDEF domain-containing protein [Acidothermus sp.]|nr:GGDEF domain-containing protein [Acidothermus sp.]
MGERGSARRLGQWLRSAALAAMSPRARAYVITVDALYLAVVAAGLATIDLHLRDGIVFVVLIALAIVSIETSLRFVWHRPPGGGSSNDLLAVWTLPVALLLPPVYSAVVVVPLMVYVQLRVVRRAPVKLFFSIASTGIAGYLASSVHQAFFPPNTVWTAATLAGSSRALLATASCVVVRYVVNWVLVDEVVALTKPGHRRLALLRDRENLGVSAAEACMGILVALAYATSLVAVPLALPPVLVFQRTLLIAELRHAARTDPKTGLANATYWREVAEREVARARSGGEALAILLVDVDHFKAINDRFGHLIGDEVLRAVARGLTHGLRPRDFVGRFGGEEFVILLTGSDAEQARHAAERIRGHIAGLRVETPLHRESVGVTISVGVAAFRENGHSVLELLDAADSALYAAKRAGRNCVRVATGVKQQVLDLTGDVPRLLEVRADQPAVVD